MWYVYMLKCQDGAIYTGITDDIARRFKEHAQGKGGHYTNCNRPREVLYKEPFEDRLDAEQREQQIKRWSKVKKLALIGGDKSELINLSKSRD
ncbi:MAG: GIY-YIG nuclease family protein [Candidatus Omnitrophota bacterium]|nr:GIY-YIG nuclease family protein [Candidatus Omnitrophota bacterium]